jgi:UDP-N-acetylglucosamine transferase subunit ALG13
VPQETNEKPTVVLVAGSGGHLTQLRTLSSRIAANYRIIWVTDKTSQSESLLAGEDVVYLPYRAPRDVIGTVKNAWILHRALARIKIIGFYSTGAGIALSCILPAAVRRVPLVYIESATRVTGLSLTGMLLSRVPGVRRFVQYPHAVNSRWRFAVSVFDGYSVRSIDDGLAIPTALQKMNVLVTVGANQQTGFRSLIDSLLPVLPSDADVFWQYGPTDVSDLDLTGSPTISAAEMSARMTSADVVICHAGTGSTLMALQNGKKPIVVPRRFSHGEHVDDHQSDLAAFLDERKLAVVRQVGSITVQDLVDAANHEVTVDTSLAPVDLLASS